jgi:hypothetical protein
MGNRSYVRCEAPDMESCRSVFLGILHSVTTRRLSGAFVASRPGSLLVAAGRGALRFTDLGNRRQVDIILRGNARIRPFASIVSSLALFFATNVIKILAVIAGLVLIVFPVWWLEKTAVPLPVYRKGGFADYAYLVYAVLAVYGSVLFGIAVQIVRAKRTMQPLSPFGLFKAGLGGVLAVVIAFFTIGGIYGLMRFGAVEKGVGNFWGLVAIFWTVFGALVSAGLALLFYAWRDVGHWPPGTGRLGRVHKA